MLPSQVTSLAWNLHPSVLQLIQCFFKNLFSTVGNTNPLCCIFISSTLYSQSQHCKTKGTDTSLGPCYIRLLVLGSRKRMIHFYLWSRNCDTFFLIVNQGWGRDVNFTELMKIQGATNSISTAVKDHKCLNKLQMTNNKKHRALYRS